MTEPTRDALHVRTLEMLQAEAREYGTRMKSAYPEERAALAEEYAYAAACVRLVAELEAEVALLRETGQRMFDERNEACANLNDARAELCELRVEVERLRAKAAIVDAMERGEILQVERTIATKDMRFYVRTIHQSGYGETVIAAYAAATREGTDA